RGLLRWGGDDRRVLHRPFVTEQLVHLRDRRSLLADRDVDAPDVRVLLVQDRVEADRGLTGLAVADDQLTLATADVRHRVDRLDAGLQRLLHRLASDDTWRLELERPLLGTLDGAAAVEGIAERVHDTSEQPLAHGDARNPARALHELALLDVLPLAEERRAHVV